MDKLHTTQGQPADVPQFKKELGLFDATMLVMGCMIGSGIFVVSADIARMVGSPGYLILTWLIAGFITLIAALSYGELAGMMPHAGGQYVYLREAYNPFVGFLFGWTLFLVIQTGSIAAISVAFAKYTGELLPFFSERKVVISLVSSLGVLNISRAQLLAIGIVVILTVINICGVRKGKLVQNVFTITKIGALLGLIGLGIFLGRNDTAITANFSNFWSGTATNVSTGTPTSLAALSNMMLLSALGVAMVGALFASDGWSDITFIGGEVVNPKRNIPLSLAMGTAGVTMLYVLANLSYLFTLPVTGDPQATEVVARGIQGATSDRVATAAVSIIFGQPAVVIMAILIMISTFGCCNGSLLSGPRVYYSMAKDGLFFKKLGSLNRKGVPAVALVVQGCWACLLCLSGRYGDLLDYVIFSQLLFFVLTVAGVFILRWKQPHAERPYKTFGYPVLPILYIMIGLAICADLLVFKPNYTWPGLCIVLSGIPVYFLWAKLLRKPV